MTASLDNSELWILTAKQNELNDVLDWFRSNSEGKGCKISIAENSKARKDKDGNKYYPGTITFTAAAATRTVGFVMACGFRQGPESFAIFASYVFSTFKPKHAMMLGICCGDPKEHKLKDVVFSCRAFNYYEGKIKDKEMKDDDGGETHYPETVTYYTDPNISNLVDEIIGRSRRSEWKSATMVSGPVVQEKAEKVFLRCQVIDRKCTALDMEASAFFNACAMYRKSNEVTPLPVIKAVSDAGDENKNDDCHRQCLYNAADAALSFIIQYFGDKHPDPPLESPAGSETNPPGELKETSRTETNPPGELKETSRTVPNNSANGSCVVDGQFPPENKFLPANHEYKLSDLSYDRLVGIGMMLDNAPHGTGSAINVAELYGMKKLLMGDLARQLRSTGKGVGFDVINFLSAKFPHLTVYKFCSTLISKEICRNDIAKVLCEYVVAATTD